MSAVCSVSLAGCGVPKPGVMVFVAASAGDVMTEVGDQFTADTGISVSINAAGSSVLAKQIAAGANADVFLSANVAWCDYLEERGAVADRIDLLGNRLVIIVPSGRNVDIASPDDLLREEVDRIAVADTTSVPAGQYAKQALVEAELWSGVESKLLPGADVRQALVYVERGEADAGIVYATDAAESKKVRVVYTFDVDVSDPIVYPLVLTKTGARNVDAVRLFDFLQTQEASAKFSDRRFMPSFDR